VTVAVAVEVEHDWSSEHRVIVLLFCATQSCSYTPLQLHKVERSKVSHHSWKYSQGLLWCHVISV